MLINPKNYTREYPDDISRQIMEKTIEFFETKGKQSVLEDYTNLVWYQDLIDFLAKEKVFSTLLTPSKYGENTRWDTWRNVGFNEILGFFGLQFWYVWQVSILGLGPIWGSNNEVVKKLAAEHLKKGGIFGFGLSEKEHGADIYTSDMVLKTDGNGNMTASGSKYYIGNGNKAAMVSVFGISDPPLDSEDKKYGKYVFFVVDTQHENYELVKNVVATTSYVAEFKLNDYPIKKEDILATGRDAFDMTLNSVNVGKFNLGWASIGICTHAFYEAINHASHRKLFNNYVTDFPHVKQLFVDAYTRLIAMKLFGLRGADYMRIANPDDRRYLLYDPMVKMKVTTQGEEVIDLLWDVIAAKGFERDMYFSMAAKEIRALPKLEGTVHVNMALVIKFMKNYFFNHKEYEYFGKQDKIADDEFLFNQGRTSGLGKIQFDDYNKIYNSRNTPNIKIFKKQIKLLKQLLIFARPSKEQSKDIDFLLILGELFTLVVYGELIIDNANIYKVKDDLLDQIFNFIVRDFSKFALQLIAKPQTNFKQRFIAKRMIKRQNIDQEQFLTIWKDYVLPLKDLYDMNP